MYVNICMYIYMYVYIYIFIYLPGIKHLSTAGILPSAVGFKNFDLH